MYRIYTKKLVMPERYARKILLIMRFTTVILIASLMQVSATTLAQKISLSKTNASLKAVIKEIRAQSGYEFIYTESVLKEALPVTINIKALNFEEVLEQIFRNQPLSFSIDSKTVIIKQKDKNLFEQLAARFQAIDIRGRVLDENSQPMYGATVKVKGTSRVATTNGEGIFTLRGIDENATLEVSYLGYQVKEIKVTKDTRDLTIRLLLADSKLNEVVVTALGIKREERALGYAITKIDSNQITNAPAGNWIDALSGKVAGLNMVRSNGGPAGSNKIILRGENNLTGGADNEALIVIDGVVVNNGSGRRTATGGSAAAPSDGIQPTDFGSGINDLNPEDIESITVLKGPGAAALYGQRGANGAIIVTTKSGSAKSRGVSITLNANAAFESANRWPDLQYEYGQGQSGADTYGYGLNSASSLAFGPRFNGQSFVQYDPVTQAAATEATPWVPYKNQIREFFETGKTFTNSISISGNIKKNTTFRVSATHADNEWIIPNTGYKRNNISFSANSKITSKLSLTVKGGYTNRESDNLPGMGYGNQSVMYWYVFWVPNADINWLRNYWTNGKEYRELKDVFTASPENPYAISYEFINGSKRNGITGNAQLNYAFTKALSLQLRATLDRTIDDRVQKRPWTAARLATGSYRTQDIVSKEYSGDFLLKYNKQLNKDFSITATVGGSMLKNRYSKKETRADGLIEPNVYSFDNAENPLVYVPDTSRFSLNSVYGLFSASYKSYLYLDVTSRMDWNSTLANPFREKSTGFFYPSANLSFIASDYFSLPKTISFAKLRLSVSQVGSGGTIPYRTAYLYGLAANGTYPNGSLQNPTTIPNPDLQPLKTTAYEIGADIKLFKNRLGIDIAAYAGNTKNQILERIVDRSSGYTRQIINAGQIDNSGLEVAMNGTLIQSKSFKWTTFMTFATNKNKIIALANNDTTVLLRSSAVGGAQIIAKVGGSMGDMYGTGFLRAPDGQVVYNPTTGIPLLSGTPVYLGNTIPKYKASIGTEFSYKQFKLNVLFDAQKGGVAHSYTHGRLADFGKLSATLPGRYSGITGKGVVDNGDGTYSPNTTIATDITSFYNTTMGTLNGEGATYKTDFIKFREARFDYTLPKSLLRSIKISRATIGVYGRNLVIWSNWPMFDPEFGTLSGTDIVQGFEIGQFPSTRTYGFNLVIGIN
ncbi:SusC/RagA family TonB-linked outer membrane protein [Pedobacter heparinus]|uniref:TonB-dependent receptor plug n=1 Tax=Pedobacter heparinus (strain ATCC 13125 / DSM 2366 / CIP 104194 / JCM 7457 / NBRC 12017 / NCIMB 9290 / NRRL B-14731 / HIM 762-3) TaxID=485917 RepID=C6XUX2_PEDHD|nr:SusC/RagA family TonB-linked outer membrane protein [Pedobacter heparinus]ACU05980.1 TonB-dependent receptor plug [Pedobacter heparinus DSM 2366]